MEDIRTRIVGLLIAAIIVALAARRLRLPYTVGLVIAGVGLALARLQTGALLTHDMIFDLILPPLLFEAALCIHWHELRRDLAIVLTLATLGVAISAAVVAAGMVRLLGWPLEAALVFGVLIAATDPVSVIALFKDLRIGGRLRFLVESESLLNDGVAAVLFTLALAWAEAGGGAAPSAAYVAWSFVLAAGGGTAIGLASGLAAITVAGRTSDYLVETALTGVAAYESFYLAEYLHCSGVLATVAAGLVMGNLGLLRPDDRSLLSVQGRAAVEGFWEFAAFLANSFVFLLIGLAVADIPLVRLGPASFAVIILLVLAGRAVTVYPICAVFRWSGMAVPMAEQHVLWWGGLRGALALALALALPPDMPRHGDILIATFGVVVFSVVVQGLTMQPLLLLLGLRSSVVGRQTGSDVVQPLTSDD
jgi:CPA1 family monovalent cation:H+ antiporter